MRVPVSVPSVVKALGTAGAAAVMLALLLGGREASIPKSKPAAVAGSALILAEHLARASLASIEQMHPGLDAVQARALARRRRNAIPLPSGGTFSGIRWEEAVNFLTPGEVEQALQRNARCQWLRALSERRQTAVAAEVVKLTAQWPAVRIGGSIDPAVELTDCYAAHQRETRYARERGYRVST